MRAANAMRGVLAIAAATASLFAQSPEPLVDGLTEDQRALFALLDALDPLDTSKCPIVRAEIRRGDHEPYVVHGFLIEQNVDRFVVRDPRLVRHDIARTRRADDLHGSFVASDLHTLEERVFEALRDEANDDFDFFFEGEALGAVMVVVRDQARRRNFDEVHRLWNRLTARDRTRLSGPAERITALAPFFRARLLAAVADPSVSCEQLIAMHETFLKELPGPYSGETGARRNDIASVLAERRRRAEVRGPEPTIDDLVFDLHDEFRLPNGRTLCTASRNGSDGPLQKVVAAGLAAVPALIAALVDMRPTRCCVERVTLVVEHDGVLPMARVTEAALVEIAGWSPEGDDRRAVWRQWLADARARSPEALLEERALAFDSVAVEHLVRRLPARADRLVTALRAAEDSAARREAIAALLRGMQRPLPETVLQFLADEVANDAVGRWQAEAANSLGGQRRTDAIAVAAKGWLDRVRDATREIDADDTAARARFLLQNCGDAAAADALRTGCDDAFGRRSLALALAAMLGQRSREIAAGPSGAAFRATLQRLLTDEAFATVDVDVVHGDERFVMNTASVADVAAATLAMCWPTEFSFDPTQTASVRRLHRRAPNEPLPKHGPVLPANLVTSVDIDAALRGLPETTLTKLRALQGRELSDDTLVDAVIRLDIGAKGRCIAVFCERTGLGDGTTIRVAAIDRAPAFPNRSEDRRCWLVTSGGARVRAPTTTSAFDSDSSAPSDDAAHAMRLPAATPVEITVIVGGR